jgi:putative tryptophan/tyrosine transport system substrate-binding protein
MTRREFLLLLGGVMTITRAVADDAPRRIFFVAGAAPARSNPNIAIFEDELRQLGYRDGHNIVIDYLLRSVDLTSDALTEAIAAQIARGARVIIAYGPERTLKAAVAATRDVPIVMAAVDYDPLAKGYIASLARPGGNITGVFFEQIELAAKRLDLFKEAVPDMRRAAMLWDKISADQYEAAHKAAASLDIPTVSLEFRDAPYDYERALSEAEVGSGDGLMVMTSPIFTVADRERLAALALQHRLPSMFVFRDSVEAGGLMSYGATATEMYRLVARYVGRILKGAMPADLPVQQPTRFELVVNLKTAQALGLTVPPSILARADEVIE